MQVYKWSEERVLDYLDTTAYLLFYVKQGSSPWFSSLLEKENTIPADDSAEQVPGELHKDKEESKTTNDGSDSLGERTEDGKLEHLEGCSLGGISERTHEPNCLTGSGISTESESSSG
jgi:ubiquitin carboxyl-terminal hydrolase 36/42